MLPLRQALLLAVLALVVGGLLLAIWFIVLPAGYPGAETRSGSVTYQLEPPDFWRYTRTLETRLLLTDLRGITRCAEDPVVGVILHDPVGCRTSRHAVDAAPELIHEDTLAWNIRMTIPKGWEYCGAYLEDGCYLDMSGRIQNIGWSISAFEEE